VVLLVGLVVVVGLRELERGEEAVDEVIVGVELNDIEGEIEGGVMTHI